METEVEIIAWQELKLEQIIVPVHLLATLIKMAYAFVRPVIQLHTLLKAVEIFLLIAHLNFQ